jgi:hypothetical protein
MIRRRVRSAIVAGVGIKGDANRNDETQRPQQQKKERKRIGQRKRREKKRVEDPKSSPSLRLIQPRMAGHFACRRTVSRFAIEHRFQESLDAPCASLVKFVLVFHDILDVPKPKLLDTPQSTYILYHMGVKRGVKGKGRLRTITAEYITAGPAAELDASRNVSHELNDLCHVVVILGKRLSTLRRKEIVRSHDFKNLPEKHN